MLRDGSDRPVVWVAEDADGPTATRPGPDEHHGGELVASEAAADALAFADVDGAAEARQFVENTDFDRASVYLEHEYVEACYTLDLCRASWADGIDTSYGRVLRDHDVACEAETHDTVAVLVRLPVTLDPDEVRNRGTSISGSGCEILPPERGGPSPESRRGTTGEATDSASTGEGER